MAIAYPADTSPASTREAYSACREQFPRFDVDVRHDYAALAREQAKCEGWQYDDERSRRKLDHRDVKADPHEKRPVQDLVEQLPEHVGTVAGLLRRRVCTALGSDEETVHDHVT